MKRMFFPSCLAGGEFRLCSDDEPSAEGSTERGSFFALLLPARTDFAHLDGGELGGRTCSCRFERLLARAVEQEKPTDDLLRLGERPIDQTGFAVAHLHARPFRGGTERIGS